MLFLQTTTKQNKTKRLTALFLENK